MVEEPPGRASRSLGRRLTLTYTIALAIGLVLFCAFSLAAIDRVLRSTLDARLATTLRAFAATATGHIGPSEVDPTVVDRLREEIGIAQEGAIVEPGGAIAMQSGTVDATIIGIATIGDANAGDIAYATVPENGGLRVATMRVASDDGVATLVVWRPLDVIADYERIALATLLGASAVILLAAFATGRFIVARSLRPLRAMAAIASEIEANDLSRRLTSDGWDAELRELATTFDRMLDRLQSAFARQRQFTADASHDLRAPLAVMRAETELALARARDAADDEAAFASIRDEVRQFDALLEALLLSARADAEPIGSARIDLARIAERACERLEAFATSAGVRIERGGEHVVWTTGNAELLERVVASVLHNGIKFSPVGGRVFVVASVAGEYASLVVRDEGSGFSPEALEHACDRFWRDDSARGRSGSGLGLAIAKSAIERFGGSVTLRNAASGGAQVELRVPRSFA